MRKPALLYLVVALALLPVSFAAAAGSPQTNAPVTGQTGPDQSQGERAPQVQPGAATFALRMSRLLGFGLVDLSGSRVGQVENFLIQLDSSEEDDRTVAERGLIGAPHVIYLVASLSGQPEAGRIAIPLAATRVNPDLRVFVLEAQEAQLQELASFNQSDVRSTSDATWDTNIREFWQNLGINAPEAAPDSVVVTATELMGLDIISIANEDVGEVQDLVTQFAGQVTGTRGASQGLSTQPGTLPLPGPGETWGAEEVSGYYEALDIVSATIRYALVGRAGQSRTPVPLSAMRLDSQADAVILDADPSVLRQVPAPDGSRQLAITDPGWDREVAAYWEAMGYPVAGTFPAIAQSDSVNRILYRATRLIGFPVVDLAGDELGEVEDIIFVAEQSASTVNGFDQGVALAPAGPAYALVGFGGFLGLGETLVPVPLSAMRLILAEPVVRYGSDPTLGETLSVPPAQAYDPAAPAYPRGTEFVRNGFLINASQATLEAGPAFEDLDLRDPNWDADVREYWLGQGLTFPEKPADALALRVSDLTGWLFDADVLRYDGEAVGDVADLLVEFDLENFSLVRAGVNAAGVREAAVRYLVVGYGGFLGLGEDAVPVPLRAFEVDPDATSSDVYLDIEPELLDAAPMLPFAEAGAYDAASVDSVVLGFWADQGFGPFGTPQPPPATPAAGGAAPTASPAATAAQPPPTATQATATQTPVAAAATPATSPAATAAVTATMAATPTTVPTETPAATATPTAAPTQTAAASPSATTGGEAGGPTAGSLASSGEQVFASQCAQCHGQQGEGVTAPAVMGAGANLSTYSTAQGLLDYISSTMPLTAPGSLSEEEYRQVTGFLLLQNGHVQEDTDLAEGRWAEIELN